MYLLLPMDGDDFEENCLVPLADVKIWLQVCIENGEVVETNFAQEFDGFEMLSEAVVVKSDSEYVWPFMEQNMMVLVAHTQRYLDDVVEAYLFRELHELAY